MFHVIGKITKRILSGEIDQSAVFPPKTYRGTPPPDPKTIKAARGQGMGKGATRKRSGPGASTDDF